MSGVRILTIIVLLLFTLVLVNNGTWSMPWVFQKDIQDTSEKSLAEGDPPLKEDPNKHTATSGSSSLKTFSCSTSLVHSVIESRHSSICLLKVCLRC